MRSPRQTPAPGRGGRAVRAALRRGGLTWNGERAPPPLLVPRGTARARHYRWLGHYSYRLFLRDVLKRPTDLRPAALTRYVSPPVARRYLHFLAAARLVTRVGRSRYSLRDKRVGSFGGALAA